MLALAVLGEYWPSVVFVRVKILQRALGWSGVIFCIHLSNFGSKNNSNWVQYKLAQAE